MCKKVPIHSSTTKLQPTTRIRNPGQYSLPISMQLPLAQPPESPTPPSAFVVASDNCFLVPSPESVRESPLHIGKELSRLNTEKKDSRS